MEQHMRFQVARSLWMASLTLALLVCRVHGDEKKDEKKPVAKEPFEAITDAEIDKIDYDDAAIDQGVVTPLAKDLSHMDDEGKKKLQEMDDKLDGWEPGVDKSIGQQVRYWIALCTLQDIGHGEYEAEIPYLIFERLKKEVPKEKLTKALAWVILKPDEGKIVKKCGEIGVDEDQEEAEIRDRSVIYAKKLLGRLKGKLPPKD